MPRQTGRKDGKVRVIAIYRMLQSGKLMNSAQIIEKLHSQYGIEVERKTVYSDIAAIDRIMPIKVIPGRWGGVLHLGCCWRM